MANEKAIIGKIPGYNKNIDKDGIFEKELKKGITYVDFYPTSFTLTDDFKDSTGNAKGIFDVNLKELFGSPGFVETVPPGTRLSGGTKQQDPSSALFSGVLERMRLAFGIDSSFSDVKALRLIAANDSTFNEVFSNSYDQENMVTQAYAGLKGKVQGNFFARAATWGMKTFDSAAMQELVGYAYRDTGAGFEKFRELVTGSVLGMNLASPKLWSGSQYNSTLTMFVKLVSPTGQEECIRKNILEPLLYLIAASSPITAYGIVYGYPFMWQVHAHGITNFRVGAIAALSIVRGSFETTFTTALQPTVIDVRLTIVPLINDFAVQTGAAAGTDKNIYDYNNAKFLGVQNPADINRGTMNTGPMGGSTRKQDPVNIVSVPI